MASLALYEGQPLKLGSQDFGFALVRIVSASFSALNTFRPMTGLLLRRRGAQPRIQGLVASICNMGRKSLKSWNDSTMGRLRECRFISCLSLHPATHVGPQQTTTSRSR